MPTTHSDRFRVTNPSYVGALNEYITYGGDGWVQLVEFTPNGAKAGVLLDYGDLAPPLPT